MEKSGALKQIFQMYKGQAGVVAMANEKTEIKVGTLMEVEILSDHRGLVNRFTFNEGTVDQLNNGILMLSGKGFCRQLSIGGRIL
jgi:hypothetical protein